MASFIRNVSFDCGDPYGLARFWSDVVGHPMDADFAPGDTEVVIEPPGGPRLFFQFVPEGKPDEPTTDRPTPVRRHNRLHLDLRVGEHRADVVARLIARGATKLWDGRQGPSTWVTMADPEGNEFCVA
jgi:hypothetical protein